MSQRELLVDTDMLVLLGASGTLPDMLALVGCTAGQVRRLAAATAQLERGRRFRDTYHATALQAALQVARTIPAVAEAPANIETEQKLAAISAIDPGEAQLLALLAERDAWLLTTGDKRALTALAREPAARDVYNSVRGRVLCLEAFLKALVQRRGAASVAAAFSTLMTHRTITVLLSEAQVRTDEVCLRGIDSYLTDLITRTGEGFLYLPV